jgi:GNAT superfamily N-acetyltransferase
MRQYFEELDRRFAGGFLVGEAMDAAMEEAADRYVPPQGGFLLVEDERTDEILGCGAVVFLDDATAEIKRMWIAPSARGGGLGRQLLGRLEGEAARAGCSTVVLDTNGVLTEAVGMYTAEGYRPTDRYNDNPHADRWFRKSLDDG